MSIRYAEEIVELRDFLVKAGCAVGTGQALGQIADRLLRDRAFHRDLTSHVWVVIDRRDPISYSDLLGVLAIAAAGSSFAETADEDDAHRLLRFLMEARHSLESASAELLQPVERDLFSPSAPQSSGSGRRLLPWAIAAGCVLVAVLIGLWLKPRPATVAGNKPASVTPAAAGNVASTSATKETVAPSGNSGEREPGADVHPPIPRRNSRVMPSSPAVRSRTAVAAPYIPSPTSNASPPVTAAATPPTSGPPDSLTTPSRPIRAAGIASAAQAGPSAATASRPSSASSIPQESTQQGAGSISRTSKAPILLRRRPTASSSAFSEDGTNLASEGSPPAVSAAGPLRDGSAGATRGGTVHATSLGAMASNLVYSPMPAYPAAAFASHVQGEVKVSADVDRDGHVASVRVISGPPLLRDAALDAVQRWRYRPYLSSGGPIRMAAIEILDFQLP